MKQILTLRLSPWSHKWDQGGLHAQDEALGLQARASCVEQMLRGEGGRGDGGHMVFFNAAWSFSWDHHAGTILPPAAERSSLSACCWSISRTAADAKARWERDEWFHLLSPELKISTSCSKSLRSFLLVLSIQTCLGLTMFPSVMTGRSRYSVRHGRTPICHLYPIIYSGCVLSFIASIFTLITSSWRHASRVICLGSCGSLCREPAQAC